ncbi:HAMP domain-containing histidine kinase [Erythrobacter rubeus]|uniref:histidine kinase n=1 Tax=Erythrobacter rubeus TaxID=2760803 RepID=A0ABR8KVR8_9SPHN|nr:HAMP domain-containing histidine kinase [Erythrobacter rubeus]MBD2842236.1 HAMP domain-containing histidine kinase [Erythrobacter rubeus]
MFFDDRLATVLRHRAASEAGARTQFRQLLDILGNRKFAPQDERSQSLVAAAWLRMDKLAEDIPAEHRAAMVREAGWRFRSADLAAHLADHEPEVASAALNRAQLSSEDWTALIPRLPVRARGFLRLRRDLPVDAEQLLERLGVYDRGLPRPEEEATQEVAKAPAEPERAPPAQAAPPAQTGSAPEAAAELPEEPVADEEPPMFRPADPADSGRSEISALVERIAQFRRTRDATPTDTDRSPRLPLGEVTQPRDRIIRGFGFSADVSGRIDWAESEIAPMVIGTRLTRPQTLGRNEDETPLERAFARRLPVSMANFPLHGAEAIAGDWIVDAQPSFTDEGNFAGYLGRFRRLGGAGDKRLSPAAQEADRIRQLLHELRTPVTAVQGYAEVIQQQLFGPAPHEYRALAAAIAADAARILAGFEELDRLAKLETGAIDIEEGATDLADIVGRITKQIGQVLRARMAGVDFDPEAAGPVFVSLDPDDCEALIWRLLATLGGLCASGEMLFATIETDAVQARLGCELPASLIAEEDVFAADAKPVDTAINAGLFGAGFALRLARAEARSAGGNLIVEDDAVTLTLPLPSGSEMEPSKAEDRQAAG